MTSRDHDGRTVLFREVVERPDRVHDELAARTRNGIHTVVPMDGLRLLARTDRDPHRRAQQEARTEHLLDRAEDQRIRGLYVERPGLREDRVDALRGEALEVVAS